MLCIIKHYVHYHIFPIRSTLAKFLLLPYLYPKILLQKNKTDTESTELGPRETPFRTINLLLRCHKFVNCVSLLLYLLTSILNGDVAITSTWVFISAFMNELGISHCSVMVTLLDKYNHLNHNFYSILDFCIHVQMPDIARSANLPEELHILLAFISNFF